MFPFYRKPHGYLGQINPGGLARDATVLYIPHLQVVTGNTVWVNKNLAKKHSRATSFPRYLTDITAVGTRKVNVRGLIGTTYTTTSGASIGMQTRDVCTSSTECTVAVIRSCTDTTNRTQNLFQGIASASNRINAHVPWSDGNVYWDFGNATGGSGRLSWTGYSKTTNLESWCFVAGAKVGREIYLDGIRRAVDASATASFSNGITDLFQWNKPDEDNQTYYYFLVVPRAWTAQECRQWYIDPFGSTLLPRKQFWFPAAAAGGPDTFNQTVSDTLNLSDISSETAAFSVSTAETLNLADASSELADFVESLAETLNLLDTTSGTSAKVGSVAEALGFADTTSETAAFAESIAESLSLLDTATRTAIINRSLAETLNLSDTATGTTGIAIAASEALNLADTASEIATFLRSVSENLSLTDTAARTWTGTRTAAGVVSFADAATGVGGEAVPSTKGGLSLSEKRMRELERLQMLQRDDDEVIALIARLFR